MYRLGMQIGFRKEEKCIHNFVNFHLKKIQEGVDRKP
jgi:hypothetical protein